MDTRTQPVSRSGVAALRFSDKELYGLAEKYGTPYFLIDEATLRKKVSEMEQGFAEFKGVFRVAYSVKANFNPSVIRTFSSEGILFDLTAPSELQFILKAGGSAENVMYTSITETLAEYEEILKLGVRKVVVASYNGLLNLVEAANKVNVEVKTMIRVNPEVHVHAELPQEAARRIMEPEIEAMFEPGAMCHPRGGREGGGQRERAGARAGGEVSIGVGYRPRDLRRATAA